MRYASHLDNKLTLKTAAGLLLGLVIIIYGGFEAFDLLSGPTLEILSPIPGAILREPLVEISGQVSRVAKVYIDGRQIFAGRDGRFDEPLLLGYGYNIIEVKAADQFGRQIIKKIEVVLR
jgi:hypothetical protein